MTYSDHVNEGLCAAIDTAAAVKIDLRIVGLDHDEFDMQAVRNVKTKSCTYVPEDSQRTRTTRQVRNHFG